MQPITLKKLTIQDLLQLQQIGRQTFYETFAGDNSPEDMEKYLNESFAISKLTAEINNLNSEFYFALIENEVVGYLKLNWGNAQTELQDQNALEIERIYVLKEFHGKSVGQVLFDKAIVVARAKKVNYVWLGVWEENKRAIQFYQRNRFIPFDKHIFQLGKDEQTDILMKLNLD